MISILCLKIWTFVIRMSSVCHTPCRMSLVMSYVLVLLVCHPYVTRMWFYHEPSINNNTVVYSVNSNYLFLRGKQEKNSWINSLIKSTVYLLIFRQNSMNFKGSSNSLMESYFVGELRGGVCPPKVFWQCALFFWQCAL